MLLLTRAITRNEIKFELKCAENLLNKTIDKRMRSMYD